jgi:two-component system, OmpR family, KDP operon response regulator KdpE
MQPIATIARREAIGHDEVPGRPGGTEAYPTRQRSRSTAQAQAPAARRPPDLVILHLGHGDLDSMEVIRRLQGWTEAPVIVLSGQASGLGEVVVMDVRAGDYLSRPSRGRKSPAGSRPVGRRIVRDSDTHPVRIADLVVNLAAKQVTRLRRDADTVGKGSGIRLTPTEWRLLEVLLRNPGKLLSQQRLLAEVWGPGYARANGNLRLYVAQLRRKLEPDPARPRWLLTEPGMGYRFQPGPPSVRSIPPSLSRSVPVAGHARHRGWCRVGTRPWRGQAGEAVPRYQR